MDKIKEEVLTYFGGQKKLAKALGKTSAALSAWGKIDGKIPEVHRYKIQELSQGYFPVAYLAKCDWRKK